MIKSNNMRKTFLKGIYLTPLRACGGDIFFNSFSNLSGKPGNIDVPPEKITAAKLAFLDSIGDDYKNRKNQWN